MRTKGATSNVLVPLWVLNERFNPNAMIPIGRRFADQNSLIGRAMIANDENLKAAGNQPALEERIAIQEIVQEVTNDNETADSQAL